MKSIVFYLGIATLFTHELDAMLNHEWRVLPLTSWLPDSDGMLVFLFAHIPFFAALIALVASTNDKVRLRSRLGVGIFLVLHGLLHVLFMGNPHYEFASTQSTVLIFGGAILGIFYLVLEYTGKKPTGS